MIIQLKNEKFTEDKKLDRLVDFDSASKVYPIRSLVETKKPRSYSWRCNINLDQGNEGACVGFGISHELAARPAEVKDLTNTYAKRMYWEAQKIDPWPGGSYPGASPFYEGTSVLAGVKVAQSKGWFESYRWSFSLEDLILGVGYSGPAVLGVSWFSGMSQPDSTGFIHATGSNLGGHCILCKGVSVKKDYFLLHNSWGSGWGFQGCCYISFKDMEKLLKKNGEAVFFINRKK